MSRLDFIRPKGGFYKNKEDLLNFYSKKYRTNFGTGYELLLRDLFIENGLYALITTDFLDDLSYFLKGKKVLEIMAGRGYLGKGLLDRGVNIKVTDDMSWRKQLNWGRGYTKLERLDALSAIEKYGVYCDYIIMSWSPYEEDIDLKVLNYIRKVNRNCKIIVLGEGMGGCTGSDGFHRSMNVVDKKDADFLNRNYDRWFGIRDYVYIVN